ncbi:MAG: ATP-binding cassette domain-containing protein [Spirochaetes bacterium]|jgi:iron complex transport system ATP-binding protein|nr:ATP-binding cassette domain-containing protein [Spirochaetota bacterium]
MNALEVRKLAFGYRDGDRLFEGVDLDIVAGRVTVLLGPNGSGKSTLLALLLGFLAPKDGEIRVMGKPLSAYNRSELGRVAAFVSQSVSLPFNYPVLEYVLLGRAARIPYWGSPSATDLAAARRATKLAGAEHLAERNVQELSAGELQLVSVARALAQEPQILLLDEPTSHLDPVHAVWIFRLVVKLAREGLTVLLTTHDPLHARQVADDAVLMKQGAVLFAGGAGEGLAAEYLNRLYDAAFSEAMHGDLRIPFLRLE